jgi:hypothetical protein
MSGSSWSWSYGTFSWIYKYVCNQCLSPLKLRIQLMAMCTRYNIMWLATSRWFSPGTPVSSTNKTDRNDITEILLKVVLNTIIIRIWISYHDIPPNITMIGKNKIFWRKIVIFHTKYPKNFRASLRSAQFF